VQVKSARSAVRQALLSLGDERIGRAIVLHVEAGLSWKSALAEAGVTSDSLTNRRVPKRPFLGIVSRAPFVAAFCSNDSRGYQRGIVRCCVRSGNA